MLYLITAETDSHVNIKYIVGIALNNIEVHSLLFNFYKLVGDEFENSIIHYTISIFSITENDFDYIQSLFEKYNQKIDEIHNHINTIEDSLFGNFKCVSYESGEDEVIFTSIETNKIMEIIKSAKKLI